MIFPKDHIKKHEKASLIFIQPHTRLGNNIVSHSINNNSLLNLLDHYGLTKKDFIVVTNYYYEDLSLKVIDNNINCSVTYPIETVDENNLELCIYNHFTLSNVRFPLRKEYHHERQSYNAVYNGDGWKIEIEILVPLIQSEKSRIENLNELLQKIRSDESNDKLISISFKLYYLGQINNFIQEYNYLKDVLCKSE